MYDGLPARCLLGHTRPPKPKVKDFMSPLDGLLNWPAQFVPVWKGDGATTDCPDRRSAYYDKNVGYCTVYESKSVYGGNRIVLHLALSLSSDGYDARVPGTPMRVVLIIDLGFRTTSDVCPIR